MVVWRMAPSACLVPLVVLKAASLLLLPEFIFLFCLNGHPRYFIIFIIKKIRFRLKVSNNLVI